MQMLIGIIFVSFIIILIEMDKSEIRKMYNGNFIRRKNREIGHNDTNAINGINDINGIIPLIYKRIVCVLWKGHNYMPVSPEDLEGRRVFECKYCKKQCVR